MNWKTRAAALEVGPVLCLAALAVFFLVMSIKWVLSKKAGVMEDDADDKLPVL